MKILYIDVPFADEKGGDKNRSRFLWNQVCTKFDADLLLIQTDSDFPQAKLDAHQDYRQLFLLKSKKPAIWKAQSIYSFSRVALRQFQKIISENHYDIVLFRFCSQADLANIVRKVTPESEIIIDVDLLFSRLAVLSWEKNPTFKNRQYYFEKNRLRRFERRFFRKPYYFFFASSLERDYVLEHYHLKHLSDSNFLVLPNVMESMKSKISTKKGKDILFFGMLNSIANEDAFLYCVNWILPMIRDDLMKTGDKIRIVGTNPTPIYQSFSNDDIIDIIGSVDDIDQEIQNCH